MDAFTVRQATPADAQTAADIVRRSIEALCVPDHGGDPQRLQAWLANKTADNFQRWIGASLCAFLAERAGTGGGFALVTSAGELALLYVTPELQHRGAGKALLAACEGAVRTAGLAELKLDSTRTARDFYGRNGFSDTGPPQDGWGMTCYPMAKRARPVSPGPAP